jgi:hypothetical protein
MDDFIKGLDREEEDMPIVKHSQINPIEDKTKYKFKEISQSLVKVILSNKPDMELDLNFPMVKEYCPLQIFYKYIAKTYPEDPTEQMYKGLYFETKVLGSSAKGMRYDKAPKNKTSLGIPLDYERINRQVENAHKTFFNNFITISNMNTQVPMKIFLPKFDIIVTMELDIFPTPILHGDDIKLSIVDLKLTKDITSTYGAFCWARPEYMDHIQADLYSYFVRHIYEKDKRMEDCKRRCPHFNYDYIFQPNIVKKIRSEGIMFHYAVFGYTESEKRDITLESQKKILYREPTIEREQEMIKRLVYAIEILKEEERKGWKAKPSFDNCKTCKLRNGICTMYNEINKI